METKNLVSVGTISLSQETEDAVVEYIVPYEKCIGAILSTGVFLILHVKEEEIKVKGRMEFGSRIMKFIPNPSATHPETSFYAITSQVRNTSYLKLLIPFVIIKKV